MNKDNQDFELSSGKTVWEWVDEISQEGSDTVETLPPMTAEELDAFISAEDEVIKEDRGEVPVVAQLEEEGGQIVPLSQVEINRLAQYLMEHWPEEIEGSAVDTAIKVMTRYGR